MIKLFFLFFLFFFNYIIISQEISKNYFGSFNKIDPLKENSMNNPKDWHKNTVFYHIWVRSFYDSDEDGIGDIKGIIKKLDYLNDGNPKTDSDLGINGIWLSPIFDCYNKSIFLHGYDTIDYYKINPKFGTEQDVIELLKEAHKRGIRVIFDYVVNHCSHRHPWFLSSRKNEDNKRDWFIWESSPDTRYQQAWGGGDWKSVWHRYKDSYYYGVFGAGMPDLNLKNIEVRQEMANVLIYWLNKGFDGIRIDAARYIMENGYNEVADIPETHNFFKKLKSEILEKYRDFNSTKIMVAEAWTDSIKIAPYYGNGEDEFDMCFNFPLAYLIRDIVKYGSKSSGKIINFISKYQEIINLYPKLSTDATFLSNHDLVAERPATEYKEDKNKSILAFALNVLLPGSPFIYYGNEIDMTSDKSLQGDGKLRTFFKWERVNTQLKEKDSVLNWYKYLIKIKNKYQALNRGEFSFIKSNDSKTLGFIRYYDKEYIINIFNFKEETSDFLIDFSGSNIPEGDLSVIIGSFKDGDNKITKNNYSSFQVLKMKPKSFRVYYLGKNEQNVAFDINEN